MKNIALKYIELKSGYSDNGPAWIGQVSFSKTGRTVYFNGKAFYPIGAARISGNYVDIESGEEYWISGVKKDMKDRHWAGGGKIMIEKSILPEYLNLIRKKSLPKSGYELVEVIAGSPVERIYELENKPAEPEEFDANLHFKQPNELTIDELKYVIDELAEDEVNVKFNKARRFTKRKRLEFEAELEKRVRNVG